VEHSAWSFKSKPITFNSLQEIVHFNTAMTPAPRRMSAMRDQGERFGPFVPCVM
jgi:hypothetical protein